MIWHLVRLNDPWRAIVFTSVVTLALLGLFARIMPEQMLTPPLLGLLPFLPCLLLFSDRASVVTMTLPIPARTLFLASLARVLVSLWLPALLYSAGLMIEGHRRAAAALCEVAALATVSASIPRALYPTKSRLPVRFGVICIIAFSALAFWLLRSASLGELALWAAIASPVLWFAIWLVTPPAFDSASGGDNELARAVSGSRKSWDAPAFAWVALARAVFPKFSLVLPLVLPTQVISGNWLMCAYLAALSYQMDRSSFVHALPISRRRLLAIRLAPGAVILLVSYAIVALLPELPIFYGGLTLRLAAIAVTFTAAYAMGILFAIGIGSWYRVRRLPARMIAVVLSICFVGPLAIEMVKRLLSVEQVHRRLDYGLLSWLDTNLPSNAALLTVVLLGIVAAAWYLVDWQHSETEITGIVAPKSA